MRSSQNTMPDEQDFKNKINNIDDENNSKSTFQWKKINGFTRKPHLYQIISYIFYLLDILIFIFIILPFQSQSFLEILLSSLYFVSVLFLSYYAYYATVVDPTDQIIIAEKKAKHDMKFFNTQNYEFFCNTCDAHCSVTSKHCKQCDRCVEKFDHHCKWLNNCIGANNYKYFAVLIVVVLINNLLFCLSALLILLDNINVQNQKLIKNLYFDIGEAQNFNIFKIILYIFTIITFIFLMLDANLLIFHIYLYKNKLTTYDYIINKRQTEGEKRQKSPYIKSKGQDKISLFCCGNKGRNIRKNKKNKSKVHSMQNPFNQEDINQRDKDQSDIEKKSERDQIQIKHQQSLTSQEQQLALKYNLSTKDQAFFSNVLLKNGGCLVNGDEGSNQIGKSDMEDGISIQSKKQKFGQHLQQKLYIQKQNKDQDQKEYQ